MCPGGELTIQKSSAIREVGAFEHELGFVVISNKDVMKSYSSTLGLQESEVWTLLTSLEIQGVRMSEYDHIFLVRGKFVNDIKSSVPQSTLDNVSEKFQLKSCLRALVEANLLSQEAEVTRGGGAGGSGSASVGRNYRDRGGRGRFNSSKGEDRYGNYRQGSGRGSHNREDSLAMVEIAEEASGKNKLYSRVDRKMLEKNHTDYLEEAKPANTKKSTKAAITLFNNVMEEVALPSMEDTTIEDLPNNLNTFFRVLRKPSLHPEEEAGYYNASSLETYFQSLARSLKEIFTVDIKSDVRFHKCRETLKVKKQESAAHAEVAGKHAKKAIPAKCLALAYAKDKLGTSNPQALSATVALGAMGSWGCRLKEENYSITNGDLVYGPVDDGGVPEYIQLSERLTKVMRGQRREARELDKRMYADKERPETCPVRAVLEMQRRKTEVQLAPEQPLYWTCRQLKGDPQSYQFWFTSVRMGVHKIASLIPDQLKAAGVDVKALKISGYSGRKTTLQGGLESGIPGPYLAKVAGQKAYSSTGSYITHEDASAKAMSMCISRRAHGDDDTDFEKVLGNIRREDKLEVSALKSMNDSNGASEEGGDKRKNKESVSNLVEKPPEVKKLSTPSSPKKSQAQLLHHPRQFPVSQSPHDPIPPLPQYSMPVPPQHSVYPSYPISLPPQHHYSLPPPANHSMPLTPQFLMPQQQYHGQTPYYSMPPSNQFRMAQIMQYSMPPPSSCGYPMNYSFSLSQNTQQNYNHHQKQFPAGCQYPLPHDQFPDPRSHFSPGPEQFSVHVQGSQHIQGWQGNSYQAQGWHGSSNQAQGWQGHSNQAQGWQGNRNHDRPDYSIQQDGKQDLSSSPTLTRQSISPTKENQSSSPAMACQSISPTSASQSTSSTLSGLPTSSRQSTSETPARLSVSTSEASTKQLTSISSGRQLSSEASSNLSFTVTRQSPPSSTTSEQLLPNTSPLPNQKQLEFNPEDEENLPGRNDKPKITTTERQPLKELKSNR